MQQRFRNFEKAFLKLKEAAELEELNELERNGLVQQFEFTLDLSWKVMKDFLEEKGFNFKPSPKDTIRLAEQSGYIDYGQELMMAMILEINYCTITAVKSLKKQR